MPQDKNFEDGDHTITTIAAAAATAAVTTAAATAEQLARIDERTTALLRSVQHIERSLETQYVTQKEFSPIKSIVYGMVGVILLAVCGGLIALVLK